MTPTSAHYRGNPVAMARRHSAVQCRETVKNQAASPALWVTINRTFRTSHLERHKTTHYVTPN